MERHNTGAKYALVWQDGRGFSVGTPEQLARRYCKERGARLHVARDTTGALAFFYKDTMNDWVKMGFLPDTQNRTLNTARAFDALFDTIPLDDENIAVYELLTDAESDAFELPLADLLSRITPNEREEADVDWQDECEVREFYYRFKTS